jgi:molybdate/tungstate transport system permease protein
MSKAPSVFMRSWIIPGVCAFHLVAHILGATLNWFDWYDGFLLVLLAINAFVCIWSWRGNGDPLLSLGFVLMVLGHGVVGHHLAPTSVTSAAMLMGNLLTLYVGLQLFRNCSRVHQILFVASYVLLYVLFVKWLDNAEPLFLVALLGLAGTARDLKLLSYFWALVFSFTFAQPFAWETTIISFFILKMMYSAKTRIPSKAAMLFLGVGLLLLFLVLFPIAVMMMGESAYNLLNVFKNRDVLQAVGITLITATCATGFLAILSLPLAYALTRVEFAGKAILLSLIDVPIIIPQSVAGIALLTVFGKQQILGGFLFHVFGLRFDGTMLGIVVAQIFVALPFFIKGAMAAYDAVPEKYEMAARSLGANSFAAFSRVAVPLAARGLFLSAIIAWARAAGEFGAVFFIAASPETAPIAVYTRFMSQGLAETAPLVSWLLIFSLAMFFLLQLAARLMPSVNKIGGES